MRRSTVTLVLVLGLTLAGCGAGSTRGFSRADSTTADPTSQGALVFQGNYSDPSQQWPTSSDKTRSVSSSDDTYTVNFSSAGSFDASPTIATVQPEDLVDLSVSVSIKPVSTRSGDRFGVSCRAIQGHAYAFLVGPRSAGQLAWSIELRQPGGVRQLASGTTSSPGESPYVVRGDCVEGGQNHKPVVLALYLDDNLVGQARDANLPAPYIGRPGLSVSSADGGTRVDFSNFQARTASAT
ncbi:MAG: hypothetical protein E6G01_18215 [Actinobacteria bacterium]|nr:MAG: hypothetical protein E6G01_18215 [Actinomycetota bacterium]